MRFALPLCLMCAGAPLLSGCALTSTAPSSAPIAETGPAIHGVAHGGQQPIVGAHVYLYAAGTGGYGGNGIAASSANASQSLLTSSVLTNNPGASGVDGSGNYYVVTDGGGNFVLTNDYSCSAGQQIYLYSIGGNPGSGTNSAAALLAALGDCSTISSSTVVFADEVSTVATAYAVAGFATDATHISSSGTALAQTGIYNAFANVTNLETLSTGTALATTPAGNGTVPQSTINTIADILAACLNSTGLTSTGCNTLFNNIKSSGATGTSATDTATAAIYLAHWPYPGASQMTALYGSPTPTTPFTPTLGSKPNDFTITISFSTGGEKTALAVDAIGNIWVTISNNVQELSPLGTLLTGTTGFPGSGFWGSPGALAIDTSGNIWIPSSQYCNGTTYHYYGCVYEFSSTGTQLSPSGGYGGNGMYYPQAVAITPSGNVWTLNSSSQSTPGVSLLNTSSGTVTASYTNGGISTPEAIAVDKSGNAWVANYACDASEYNASGPIASAGYTGGGIGNSKAVAIDSSGNAWFADAGSPGNVGELSPSGAPLSGSGYTSGGIYYTGGYRDRRSRSYLDQRQQQWNDLRDHCYRCRYIRHKCVQYDCRGRWLDRDRRLRKCLDGKSGRQLDHHPWRGDTGCHPTRRQSGFSLLRPGLEALTPIGIAAPVITPLSAATASSSTGPGTRP